MRIAMISTPFVSVPPKGYGGTELVVAGLVEGLLARGHSVSLYAPGDSQTPARLRARLPVGVWPPCPVRELSHAAHAVHDLVANGGVDIVHAHIAPAILFAGIAGLPMVYTVHHAPDPAYTELYDLAPTVRKVAISARQAELLGVRQYVHHGLDPRAYPLGAGRGGYASFVGRFAREKGLHVAIDTARQANVPLRIGGRWHPMDALYFHGEIAPRLEDAGVQWVGEVHHGPKVSLLQDAVATLFPIGWEEPFGLVMIESMLCGTPVLAFPMGATPEVVDEGVTGWLVDADEMVERLRWLATGSFDRARCREQAIRRFSAGRMVDEYLRVYDGVLA